MSIFFFNFFKFFLLIKNARDFLSFLLRFCLSLIISADFCFSMLRLLTFIDFLVLNLYSPGVKLFYFTLLILWCVYVYIIYACNPCDVLYISILYINLYTYIILYLLLILAVLYFNPCHMPFIRFILCHFTILYLSNIITLLW